MKVTYEFDTDKDGYDYHERDRFEASFSMLMCLSEITDTLRKYRKYDPRDNIPFEEVDNAITDIINSRVPNLEDLIY